MFGGGALNTILLTWPFALIISPFIGSFLGVLIDRLPAHRPVVMGRSACDSCGHTLTPRDLIPVVSFLPLRGRCRFCGARFGAFPLIIELAAIGVTGMAAFANPTPDFVWPGCILGWGLLALAWTDWRHMVLPDGLTLPLILLGFGATWMIDPDAMLDHAAAAAISYVAFQLIGAGYHRLRGREGLGQGDAKLMAAAGAWLGVASLSSVLLGGALLTLCGAFVQWRWTRQPITATTRLPLGTGLSVATWAVWLWQASSLNF